ncbi:MAG TPA: hypothetical protein VHT24_07705 [Pseudacidobacterium sp.]|nr:hypothetical protein [Pseudacidobacterium sp.]
MIPIVLLLAFVVLLAAGLVYMQISAQRLRSASWEDLIAKLQPMHARGLEMVALDNLQPKPNQLKLEPEHLWGLIGGTEGLRRMRNNADLLIELAAYVQRWNFEEGVIVTERMRHDAVQLKRAVFRIRMEMLLHRSQLRTPFYIHQAASAYYLMTKRLLALYETSHGGLLPVLAGAM